MGDLGPYQKDILFELLSSRFLFEFMSCEDIKRVIKILKIRLKYKKKRGRQCGKY
ncbi:MAG: hypothetical protein HFJ29_01395 [Clostridia bacterium]|nr:hypothetical protein [Clostridia bacterium]